MAKKKQKNLITHKTELLIATGIVLLLMGFGLVIAWLDYNDGFKGSSRRYADVTISGDASCLPLKVDKTQTKETCVQGVKTTSGVFYAVDGTLTRAKDNSVTVSGVLKSPPHGTDYEIEGVLKVR